MLFLRTGIRPNSAVIRRAKADTHFENAESIFRPARVASPRSQGLPYPISAASEKLAHRRIRHRRWAGPPLLRFRC